MKFEGKNPVSLEDLLRLKRAERPPAEFWEQFDRQLRAKQLKALVEKRPWWQRVSRAILAFGRFGRYRVPLGITAVVALGFVSFRGTRPVSPAMAPEAPVANETTVAVMPRSPQPEQLAVSAVPAPVVEERASSAVAAIQGEAEKLTAPAATTLASDATSPGEISQMVALLDTTTAVGKTQTPSTRQIAANLAVQSETAVGGGLFKSTLSFDRSASIRPAVEPLQQITPPTERRRSQQMLTAMVSMAAFDSAPRTSERISSGIAEQQLYERAHRFAAQGDRVHLKF